MALIRLDKFISTQTSYSRSEIKALAKKGCIAVNNITEKSSDRKIDTSKDKVSVNGNIIEYNEYLYIMMNKPAGYVSATEDNFDKTVIDLLPDNLKRDGLFPAGRLDKDTVGFVLITDDGDFAHRILSPRNHVEKTYLAKVDGEITEEHIEAFNKGIEFKDGTVCLPAKLSVVENQDNPIVEVKICEGKFHQVKKMFLTIGRKVLWLKRIKIGNLELDPNLKEGESRVILHKELSEILE